MRRLGLLAVVLALLTGGCTTLTGSGTQITAEFRDVGDLVRLADVQLSDSDVGIVTNLSLNPDRWTAVVTMRLDRGVEIPEGTEAIVRSTSLLGEKFVSLDPPPRGSEDMPPMADGGHIPLERTRKAPEIEAVFQELGGLLASGALADLGKLTSSLATIVEGQEERIGNVIDGTQRLVETLSSRREALANALVRLESASGALAGETRVIDRFLETSDEATRILADQGDDLAELVTQLDRLGESQVELIGEHHQDIQRQIDSLVEIVDKVFEAREDLDTALTKLPQFATFFAAAAPGDYIQLDIAGASPLPADAPAAETRPLNAILWEAAG